MALRITGLLVIAVMNGVDTTRTFIGSAYDYYHYLDDEDLIAGGNKIRTSSEPISEPDATGYEIGSAYDYYHYNDDEDSIADENKTRSFTEPDATGKESGTTNGSHLPDLTASNFSGYFASTVILGVLLLLFFCSLVASLWYIHRLRKAQVSQNSKKQAANNVEHYEEIDLGGVNQVAAMPLAGGQVFPDDVGYENVGSRGNSQAAAAPLESHYDL